MKLVDKIVRNAVLLTRRIIAFINQIIFYVGRWHMEWLELTANQATWIGESRGPITTNAQAQEHKNQQHHGRSWKE